MSRTLVGYITATVPAGTTTTPTPYKAKDLLQLGVTLNGGTITALGNEAVHLVSYVADADGNGSYNAGLTWQTRRIDLVLTQLIGSIRPRNCIYRKDKGLEGGQRIKRRGRDSNPR